MYTRVSNPFCTTLTHLNLAIVLIKRHQLFMISCRYSIKALLPISNPNSYMVKWNLDKCALDEGESLTFSDCTVLSFFFFLFKLNLYMFHDGRSGEIFSYIDIWKVKCFEVEDKSWMVWAFFFCVALYEHGYDVQFSLSPNKVITLHEGVLVHFFQ